MPRRKKNFRNTLQLSYAVSSWEKQAHVHQILDEVVTVTGG